ncbi:uncharacterized protein [Acropora muricata]|uniref:uncharacterized protein n=1 Tax=Acropora muricata TaxID=159855 RepID=UPI0034E510A2
MTNQWLKSGGLKSETEGFIIAAQDQAIKTNYYRRNILNDGTDPMCRICGQYQETIDHIVAGCPELAKTEYLHRHDKAASYLHWNICKELNINVEEKWYEHEPQTVTERDNITILWDMPIQTDPYRLQYWYYHNCSSKVRDAKQKEENNPVFPEFGKHGNTEAAEENNEDTHDDEGNEDNPRNDQPNSESELLSGMSFLYENYNEDAWYWELVEVIRKLLLTCRIILIGRESRTYVGPASTCSGLFAIAFAFRKPIRDKFEDKLQLTSLLVIFLNLGIGVILKIPKESVPSDVDQYVDTLLVNILVVGANVLVILLVVGRYLAVLIHNIVLWRQNPQCSASCCITIFLSLGELSSGVNSVAGGVRKTNLRVNLGIGGVDMPSMRAAVNDNVGFEIEETDDDNSKKDSMRRRVKKKTWHPGGENVRANLARVVRALARHNINV